MMVNNDLAGGIPTPLKNDGVPHWDDDIPNIWKNESHVPNHQPEYFLGSKRLTHMLSQSHLRNRIRLKYEEKKYEEYQPGLLGFFCSTRQGKRW